MPTPAAAAAPLACRPPSRDLPSADMTTLKTLLLLALVSAASADTNSNTLDHVANMAHDLFNNFTSFWGIEAPSSDSVMRTLSNMSDTIATHLSGVVKSMQTEIQAHSGQMSEAMQSASANLNRTITELQSPENRRRVEEMRSRISSGLQTLAQEATRVKSAVAEDTQGVRREMHTAFDEAVKAAQRLSDRVKAAVQEHQAEHGTQ